MNVDDVASNVIVDFGNQYDKEQVATNPVEEYVLKENIDDFNSNWETKSTVQVVDKCFETFEICSESQLNKTDGVETEIAIDCRYPDSNIGMECINDGQNGLLELKNSFFGNLKVTNNEESEIYQHIEDQNKAFDCSNEISCEYSEINCNDCNNEILKVEGEDVTTHEVNGDFSEEQNNSLHAMQKSAHNYRYQRVCDNDVKEESSTYMHLEKAETTSPKENNQKRDEKYNAHVIITDDNATNEQFNKYANSFDSVDNEECVENNITFCAQITDTNVNILQTINEVKEVILENDASQENERARKCVAADSIRTVSVSTKETNQKVDEQNNRYLYIHTEPLNRIITQNKCINIPLHQIKLCHDQQNQLRTKEDSYKKIRVLNGNLRAINIKQSDKQNAILLVSDDKMIQIDKSNISADGLKR